MVREKAMSIASDHEINEVTKRECDFYRIRMNGGWDWILATFDEKSGMVAIHSSFVTCAYSWPTPGRGEESLKEFFLSASADYLCDKFSYDHERTFREQFSFHKTVKRLKKLILEDRKTNNIDKETAREWYDDLDNLDDVQDATYFQLQLDDVGNDKEFLNHLGSDWYEYLQYAPSHKYNALENVVIPIIKKTLKDELEQVERNLFK